ncbi:hypothetical protein [Saccharibacillus brassicae]|uniref:hypothetical protein n=1 Tax=Saccharibacillus brassicae TaxID=2583377 RepID=UPI00123BE95E
MILVQYAEAAVNDQNGYPLISKVIDTLNREIVFSYKANAVTVTYAGKSLVYNKTLISGTNKKRTLSSVVNENGETTSYGYSKQETNYDAVTNAGAAAEKVIYMALTQTTYPTGASTAYEYGQTSKRLGDQGTLGYYRVTKRYDELRESTTKKKNFVAYDYANATDFSDPAQTTSTVKRTTISNPNAPSNVPSTEKITETTVLNADHLAVKETREKTGEYKKQIDTVYDPDQQLAVRITETDTDYTQKPEKTGNKVHAYTYDQYGNVLTYTNPLGHIGSYSYSATYPGLALSERNTVSGVITDDIAHTADPALPHITQTVQNYADESGQASLLQMTYQHDAYGNLTQTVQQLENDKTQQTDIEYGAAVKNAYPTAIKQKVTENGTPKTIEERYEYDLPGTANRVPLGAWRFAVPVLSDRPRTQALRRQRGSQRRSGRFRRSVRIRQRRPDHQSHPSRRGRRHARDVDHCVLVQHHRPDRPILHGGRRRQRKQRDLRRSRPSLFGRAEAQRQQ